MAAASIVILLISCRPYGRVAVSPDRGSGDTYQASEPPGKLNPIARYGGTVLTAKGMPADERRAYLWAKNLGTLVAYETYLRRYPAGAAANLFRQEIRRRFVPPDKDWQEAWQLYSQLEIIEGAVCDPQEGLILIGRPGKGRMPPFFYEDLVASLTSILAGEKVGVTMVRIFPSRFHQPDDPARPQSDMYEISVEYLSKKLWNTHLGAVLFEGDRMLKTLSAGFDIFHAEVVRSSVPGFATVIEMERALPARQKEPGLSDYGRVWIELTGVKVNTTEAGNVAMLADVKMEVRSASKNAPMITFAKHIQDHYSQYADEFVVFAEVERAARVVAIAQWLSEKYPSVAEKLVSDAYEQVRVDTPQVIQAKADFVRATSQEQLALVGGVVFPRVNRYQVDPQSRVADTELSKVPQTVLASRPNRHALAWTVAMGKQQEDKCIAWKVTPPGAGDMRTSSDCAMPATCRLAHRSP